MRVFLVTLPGLIACSTAYPSAPPQPAPQAPAALRAASEIPTLAPAVAGPSPGLEVTSEVQFLPSNTLAAAALGPALRGHQLRLLPTASALQESLAGMLGQGQGIEAEVRLEPGVCYVALGYSPSLGGFSVELVPRVGPPLRVRSSAGIALLDTDPCFQVTMTQSGTLRAVALAGGGPLVVQLYRR
ncbi:MAG: hypothetical protein MUF64_30650 [Polyangiaceae bacterium]|jgi:hypothetical protein|nr:hypothetical protein [Polyangiaceae bacterium]